MSDRDHDSIYVLMSRVMAEIQAIEKTQRNEHFNFNFRGIDDVMNHLHGPLTQHGVFFLPEVLESHVEHGTKQWHSTLRVRYTFYGPAGDSVTATVAAEGLDSSDKASTKAMSTALKYALLQVFCIPTEEQRQLDPDRSGETFDPDADWGPSHAHSSPPAARTGAEDSSDEPSDSAPVAAEPTYPEQRADTVRYAELRDVLDKAEKAGQIKWADVARYVNAPALEAGMKQVPGNWGQLHKAPLAVLEHVVSKLNLEERVGA